MDFSMPSFPILHHLMGVCSNSCPLSRWCHPIISPSVIPFSPCLQIVPASGPFPMSQLFTADGSSIGALGLASVLPMNIQGWFPLGLTSWSPWSSRNTLRVFSSTTVQKHQFFSSHINTWLLENHSFDYMNLCWQSNVSAFLYAV